MADVWKSQKRYFCEICKAWMADNRSSREIHENGNKHKEAVRAKIKEQGIKAAEKEKAGRKHISALAAMEKAALASMKANGEGIEQGPQLPTIGLRVFDPKNFKDVRSMADEMARRKREEKAREESEVEFAAHKMKLESIKKEQETLAAATVEEKVWVEADAENGQNYYWHMYTGETSWTVPSNFYTAIEYGKVVNEIEVQKVKQSGVKRPAHFDHQSTQRSDKIPKQENLTEREIETTLFQQPQLTAVVERIPVPGDIPLPSDQETPPFFVKPEPLEELESTPRLEPAEGVSSEVSSNCATLTNNATYQSAEITEEEQAETSAKPSAYGGWVRVKKDENPSDYVSPLTAKYRAEEERERREADEKNKFKREEKKIVFEEKTARVVTKKSTKVVEFKKKSGPKNVRKREETV